MGRPSPYLTTSRRKTRTMGLAPGIASVAICGIEVTQTIQDLENSVLLIADKPTVIRVYVDFASIGQAGTITGELVWRRNGGGEVFLPAMNSTRINPARPKTLMEQRHDLSESINFLLPPAATKSGKLELKVNRIVAPGRSDLPLQRQFFLSVSFESAPLFVVRAIGLRYQSGNPPRGFAPDAIHFAYLKSYLTRAYPVSALEWSQIVVDADFAPPFDDATSVLANAQVAAIRSREVSSGVHPRTHYYGLVDDNNGTQGFFMRGRAFAIPATPRPDVVASGPCGVPRGFSGDSDPSYADWYGAHELGHTFGRFHPGFPPGSQDASDGNFPYPTANSRWEIDLSGLTSAISVSIFPWRPWQEIYITT